MTDKDGDNKHRTWQWPSSLLPICRGRVLVMVASICMHTKRCRQGEAVGTSRAWTECDAAMCVHKDCAGENPVLGCSPDHGHQVAQR